jgi:REP element-mobilizing transposase RayT
MAQSLSRLWTHLIFSTKNRFPFLSDKTIRADMHAYLAKVLREQDCETLIVNGVEDHVHALFALSRTHSIASVVKETKRTSSTMSGTFGTKVEGLTLKAFANSSPRVALWQPWVSASHFGRRNSERVASAQYRAQLLQSCDPPMVRGAFPGFQSKPWAGISERLRR